ncbi:MAG: hypothetical protein COB74_05210 [Shewanella sp.]|nr:MAG: hypothetical protein COB74_05210 [Shewanella sp.]
MTKYPDYVSRSIKRVLSGRSLDPSDKAKYSFQLLNAVVQNHEAIVVILNSSVQKPSLILLRPQLEALIKGVWLLLCVKSDDVLASFLNNKNGVSSKRECEQCGKKSKKRYRNKSLESYVDDLVKANLAIGKKLDKFKSDYLQCFNNFTHAGLAFLEQGLDEEYTKITDQLEEGIANEVYILSAEYAVLAADLIGSCFDESAIRDIRRLCINELTPFLSEINSRFLSS